ncbi:MAG: VOC family protein [Bacteroidetes bacterium]|jgi:lactoylglutathione lyase|nr:VOC family protein [Bacteroidota bacterium]
MKNISLLFLLILSLQLNAQQKNTKVHINHTAIFVIDMEKTGNFYSKIIGLDSVAEPFHDGHHIWYKTSDHSMLHVIQGATEKKEYYKNQHTCFTEPEFNLFIEKLKAAHWLFEDVSGNKNAITTRVDGVHQIWLQDPDGYWLEINDDTY